MPTFVNLNLRITRIGAEAFEVTANTDDGVTAGPEPLTLAPSLLGLSPFELADASPARVREIGEGLCQALIQGQVARLFTGLYDQRVQRDRDTFLRLRLDVDERAPLIAALPWEMLYWRDAPIGTQAQTILVRWFSNMEYGAPAPLAVPEGLKTLIVIPGGSGLDTARERRIMTAALERAGIAYAILDGRVSVGSLADRLAKEDCHILHFIGHAAADVSGAAAVGVLRFNRGRPAPTPESDEDWVSHERIQALLSPYRSLRLVVLNACLGAAVGSRAPGASGRGFVGLAPSILRAGAPAVIAMQSSIRDEVAIAFAETFYSRLTSGKWAGYVDLALTLARNQCYVTYPEDIAFAAAVLFLRSTDGRLFGVGQQAPAGPSSVQGARSSGGPESGSPAIVAGRDVNTSGTVIIGGIQGNVTIGRPGGNA